MPRQTIGTPIASPLGPCCSASRSAGWTRPNRISVRKLPSARHPSGGVPLYDTTTTPKHAQSYPSLAIPAAVIVIVMVAVYWQSMRMLTNFWDTPDYSHGYLVPAFAAFLLWIRRDML